MIFSGPKVHTIANQLSEHQKFNSSITNLDNFLDHTPSLVT